MQAMQCFKGNHRMTSFQMRKLGEHRGHQEMVPALAGHHADLKTMYRLHTVRHEVNK